MTERPYDSPSHTAAARRAAPVRRPFFPGDERLVVLLHLADRAAAGGRLDVHVVG